MNKQNNKTDDQEEIVTTGEDIPADIEIEETEKISSAKIKQVKERLKTCEKDKAQILEDLQRAKADFLNTKRRLQEQADQDKDRTLNGFLESLLPLCDSFDMATADTAAWQATNENWRKGVEGIQNQLMAILKQHNVSVINTLGEHFDPERHEAVSAVDGEEESEVVVEVLQKGYERNGKIIRPAKVIIQN